MKAVRVNLPNEVAEYLEKTGDMSFYIRRLVLEDLGKENSTISQAVEERRLVDSNKKILQMLGGWELCIQKFFRTGKDMSLIFPLLENMQKLFAFHEKSDDVQTQKVAKNLVNQIERAKTSRYLLDMKKNDNR